MIEDKLIAWVKKYPIIFTNKGLDPDVKGAFVDIAKKPPFKGLKMNGKQ